MQIIKELKALFPAQQFVLTGSRVIVVQGLEKVAGDIDIILVNPAIETIELLQRIAIKRKPNFYQIRYAGKKADIWISDKPEDPLLQYDGIIISTVIDIITAKKSYSRLKDILQLRKWALLFFDPQELINNLTSIQIQKDYDEPVESTAPGM